MNMYRICIYAGLALLPQAKRLLLAPPYFLLEGLPREARTTVSDILLSRRLATDARRSHSQFCYRRISRGPTQVAKP